ncbi:MAG: hypothetical protein QOD69_491 [Solirubrobacteraceae bacterium]|nr:hypothetical protein [Solirubrobacteraceae bacterium]
MTPASLHRGAVSCRRVARDGAAVARQVKGHAPPDQVPPEAMTAVHDAMNQLQRSAIAAERQAIFLDACAHKGLLADGPAGRLPAIGLPPLLSPWPMPGVKHKDWSDKLGDLLHAAESGVVDALKDVAHLTDTAVALAALAADEVAPGASRLIPGLTKRKEQFAAGVRWAMAHPKEFLEQIGKDTIAYDKWAKGDYAGAIASDVVSLAGAFFTVAKFGRAMHVASGAAKGEQRAIRFADAKHARVRAMERDAAALRPRDAVGTDPFAARRSHVALVRAKGEAALAHERIETARQAGEAAHKHQIAAAAVVTEMINDKMQDGADQALTHPPDDAKRKEPAP